MGIEKIATCCYCGARTALVLRGDVRHELSCANCGAPLHEMKRIKSAEAPVQAKAAPKSLPRDYRSEKSYRGKLDSSHRSKKSSKRRKIGRKIFSEIFDVIEDIFD